MQACLKNSATLWLSLREYIWWERRESQSAFVYGAKSQSWQTLADVPEMSQFGSAVVWKDRSYILGVIMYAL